MSIMKIVELNVDFCNKYKEDISNYIYMSMNRGCNEEWFTKDASDLKTEELKKYVSERKAYSFIAVENNIEGFLWAYPYGNCQDVYLSIIYVDDRNRGKHVGKSLIDALEDKVKRDGYHKIWLHTDADNDISRKFYNQLGYKEKRVQLSKEL